MNRKIRFAILFAMLSASSFIQALNPSHPMADEADRFLHAMPDSLQARQTEAILTAIQGDGSLLSAVRQSRNATACLPDNVTATYVSPELRLYQPAGSNRQLPLLVYFHGGGWTFGSINSCARFCGEIAATGKAMVLAVDYALAPEHPYPEGLEDCRNAILTAFSKAEEWGADPNAISVGGDSSGGNLAIASTLKTIEENDSCPIKSLLLFYPVVKAFADGSPSWNTYGKGFALDSRLMDAFNRAYTQQQSADNPFVSVALADNRLLCKLPPTLLIAAERDILCDQGKDFSRTLKSLGVDVRREEFTGSVHLFITVAGQESAFRKAVSISADFLNPE